MKKFYSILILFIAVGFFCLTPLSADKEDPTGVKDQLATIENQYHAATLAVKDTIQLDYHPVYGHVGLRDMPVNEKGWSENQVADLFPGEKVVSYKIVEHPVTGTAFIEHQAPDGERFYVWHEVQDEPSVFVQAYVESQPQAKMAIVIYRCVNGYNLIMDEWGNVYWVERDPWDWWYWNW